MRIEIHVGEALSLSARLSSAPQAISLALRRALGTLRRRWPVIARRDIQTEYALSAQRIRAGISVRTTREGVELVGVARGVGLRNFASKRSADDRGLNFTALRGKRSFRRSGFHRRHAGTDVAFVRTPISGDERVPRTPIVRLYGPSLAQMLRKGDRPNRMAQAGLDVITADIDRLLLRSLRR
ncbi:MULTISPECIES: hypothetical protein [unclassified Lysobacter]|uniref:hypothetical protein n=1 Tax=unclassified Lysobacter TaxID=2635362 RepID=UPI001BE5743F|nr:MULTISPECIES: hypothetical protein [unclassified Lysobacter]MBT2748578.1 hypothetical protein [Lysobacter sp. ISL-42]MBT2751513.1 hypothetical protein [Lysobacter sp. ISL-50]MBT2775707.1 hypothetical protein [Lysobacter sp. ISL-54]MBT2782328.1 hypothetical protein [Lysobacter sp. ISL-52]